MLFCCPAIYPVVLAYDHVRLVRLYYLLDFVYACEQCRSDKLAGVGHLQVGHDCYARRLSWVKCHYRARKDPIRIARLVDSPYRLFEVHYNLILSNLHKVVHYMIT